MAKAGCGDYLCAMTTIRRLLLAVLCAALVPAAGGAAAKKPKAPPASTPAPSDPGPAQVIGTGGSWTAYLAHNKTGKVCYLVGQPIHSEPAGVRRKAAMAMVTHRTEDHVANVVSFDEGYPLKEGADVILQVGGEKFELFAKDDSAWARTSELDRTIVTALIKEKQAVVRASPKKGRPTADTYSLAGFAKALALIDKACDVKR